MNGFFITKTKDIKKGASLFFWFLFLNKKERKREETLLKFTIFW